MVGFLDFIIRLTFFFHFFFLFPCSPTHPYLSLNALQLSVVYLLFIWGAFCFSYIFQCYFADFILFSVIFSYIIISLLYQFPLPIPPAFLLTFLAACQLFGVLFCFSYIF